MSALKSVALVGVRSFVGGELARRVAARRGGPRLLGVDRLRPQGWAREDGFAAIDLTEANAADRLAATLRRGAVEAVVHAAYRRDPTPDLAADREFEVEGTKRVLEAVADAEVAKLIVLSSTALYGPHSDNPNYLTEDHPLRGHPAAHCVENRVAAERLLADWAKSHPRVAVTVLRSAWLLGPRYRDRATRHFASAVVTVPLGYDPLLQFVHEEDLLRSFEAALFADHPGLYNVVGPGVLPLSTLLRLAGKRALPVPHPLLYRLRKGVERARYGDAPAGFYDYLRFLWVADGARGWEAFGEPHYSTREAWIAFTSAARMRHYR